MRLPSGSKLGLGMKCMGSFLLPQVKDEAGPAAENGKELHAKLEKLVKGGREIPEDASDSDRDLFVRFNASVPYTGDELPEFGMALDVLGGTTGEYSTEERGVSDISERVLDTGRSRNFVAIADLIQRRGDELLVWDYKSSGYVGDAEWNWQLILPGCWLYVAAGKPEWFKCSLGICYIGEPVGDGFRVESNTFDAAFFESKLATLAGLQKRAQQSSPETVTLYEGKHCQYCPARHRCPAKVGALANAYDMAVIQRFGPPEAMDDVSLVRAGMTLMDSKPQIDKAMKNILKANGNEMNLGDGRIAVFESKEDKNGKVREKVYTKRAKTTN